MESEVGDVPRHCWSDTMTLGEILKREIEKDDAKAEAFRLLRTRPAPVFQRYKSNRVQRPATFTAEQFFMDLYWARKAKLERFANLDIEDLAYDQFVL